MAFLDILKQIFFNFLAHKARSCMALFGIAWGTITIILLLAIGNGFYDKTIQDLAFLNNGSIVAWPGKISKPYHGLSQGQDVRLKLRDLLAVVKNIPDITNFSPIFVDRGNYRFGKKEMQGSLIGVSEDFARISQFIIEKNNRFFDPLDIINKHRVVYLDSSLKEILFAEQNALGATIYINGIPFIVIGVESAPQNGGVHFNNDGSAYIPYTTFLALKGDLDVANILITPITIEKSSQVKEQLKHMLAMRLNFDPLDEEAFKIPDLEDKQLFVKWFFRIIQIFLAFCGIITLSIGGLGLANMMFLIVTERTREIGLRKALGAKEETILGQILLETLILVALGGFIGALFAESCIHAGAYVHLPGWLGTPRVSFITIIFTIMTLLCVGLLAGYFPARRAAFMEPIKALAF